jgi:hypothetical protein
VKTLIHKTNSKANTGFVTSATFFQPKLAINQPGDAYEQEADAIADHVMRVPDPSFNDNSFFKPAIQPIQRKCAHCEEEEKKMQRKAMNNGETVAGASTENYVSSLNGKGRSLSHEERKFFEPRMGHDFADVRLHSDAQANESARDVNAKAYTHGNNIVFGSDQYQPATENGKKLMAHELTHVVQQHDAAKNIQRDGTVLAWKDDLERRKKKVKSLIKDGDAALGANADDATGFVSGYQLTQKFILTLADDAKPSDYAIVQWVKGELYEDRDGKKVYWPASTGLYGKSSKDPWYFKDWVIDTPDADPRFGSHYNLAIKIPQTKYEDSPGVIMQKGKGPLPVGLRYNVDARMGVYPWGSRIPTTIEDWEKQKPEPFLEVNWGWDISVPKDRTKLDVDVK